MGVNKLIIVLVGVVTVAIVLIAAFTIGNQPNKSEQKAELTTEQKKSLVNEKSHLLKAKNSSNVLVVEFGDYQCPACGVAHGVFKQVKNEFKDKVNFAFRNYPLVTAHKNAMISALAAESAGAQGKFWEMHDKLYDNQDKWSAEGDAMKFFEKYAKDLGLDVEKFRKDVKDKKYEANIKIDQADGDKLGVNATPTFFINGKVFSGVLKYEDFKKEIEEALKI